MVSQEEMDIVIHNEMKNMGDLTWHVSFDLWETRLWGAFQDYYFDFGMV